MKTFGFEHRIETVNNAHMHIYFGKIQTTSKDQELIQATLENLMQVHFDNEHIHLDKLYQLKDDLYGGQYFEREPIYLQELEHFASELQAYTGWDLEFCQLITNLNYTPITNAITSNREAYLYYNSDDQVFESTYPSQEEDPDPDLTIELNNHYIHIYID